MIDCTTLSWLDFLPTAGINTKRKHFRLRRLLDACYDEWLAGEPLIITGLERGPALWLEAHSCLAADDEKTPSVRGRADNVQ